MDSELLNTAFIRELEALKRRLEIRARSGAVGEYVGPRRGGTAEFLEHRAYAHGDDPRRIDWAAYARSGQPVVKVHRAEEDSIVRILVDTSESQRFGAPNKLWVCKRLAAAVGYLALAAGQRTQLLLAHGASKPGSTRLSTCRPRRGRSALPAFFGDLASMQPRGAVDLCRAIELCLKASARPGLLTVVSDFLDPGPLAASLRRARIDSHDVALIQVLDPTELAPSFEGDLLLVDAESGEEVRVTVDGPALEAYALRLRELIDGLRRFARTHGASYTRVLTHDELEPAMRRFVSREVD